MNFSPAALSALVKGDFKNFEIASRPGGIEEQEKQGQLIMSQRKRLPKQLSNHGSNLEIKTLYEKLGFTNIQDYNNLFYTADFPEGWGIQITDHAMHSNLLDNKGRKRANIFYKAAFYDERADINFVSRFSYSCKNDYTINDYTERVNSPKIGYVYDCEKIIYQTEIIPRRFIYRESDQDHTLFYDDDTIIENELKEKCIDYLENNYPNWENKFAYWE